MVCICVCMYAALNVSVIGLERALMQYCSQPNEEPFDLKTVPIDTAPLRDRVQCEPRPLSPSPLSPLSSHAHFFYPTAVGEPTSTQKAAPAASRQDIYAGQSAFFRLGHSPKLQWQGALWKPVPS